MKAREIFEKACSYLSQTAQDTDDLAPFAPAWLDLLLAECLPAENLLRELEADGAYPPLQNAPTVSSLEDEVPYREVICRTALPYGLASILFMDDDNDFRSQDFRGRYIAALADIARPLRTRVEDLYA